MCVALKVEIHILQKMMTLVIASQLAIATNPVANPLYTFPKVPNALVIK